MSAGGEERIGIVLSGGAARGAYEAGVLAGIAEATAALRESPPLFRVVVGTSVGAVNGAWLAANAHRGDHGVAGLVRLWTNLELERHLKLDLTGLCVTHHRDADRFGPSLLDPGAVEQLVAESIDWGQLHDNIARRRLEALIIAALHVGSGVTTLFAELAPGAKFRAADHPRRTTRLGPLDPRHVLASAALPGLYPARRIGGGFFVDGGLRFNTPISPALQAGADKLVVITLRHEARLTPDVDQPGAAQEQYPSFVFLAGKVLNALLLDPVADDLQVLLRFNQVLQTLEGVLSVDERRRFDAAISRSRGAPYRHVDTLVFEPSRDIGVLAADHLRDRADDRRLGPFYRALLARAAHEEGTWEADLASYLLFESEWAQLLVNLGSADVLSRRDEVREFFASRGA